MTAARGLSTGTIEALMRVAVRCSVVPHEAEDLVLLVFPGDPQPGNTPGVVFSLPDGGLDTLIERLAAAGMEILTPVSEAPGGWYADFRDPDGHVISFFQAGEKPRRPDETSSRNPGPALSHGFHARAFDPTPVRTHGGAGPRVIARRDRA